MFVNLDSINLSLREHLSFKIIFSELSNLFVFLQAKKGYTGSKDRKLKSSDQMLWL